MILSGRHSSSRRVIWGVPLLLGGPAVVIFALDHVHRRERTYRTIMSVVARWKVVLLLLIDQIVCRDGGKGRERRSQ